MASPEFRARTKSRCKRTGVIVGILLIVVPVILEGGLRGAAAQGISCCCNITMMAVAPQVNGTFYGNSGYNTTTDPTVCDDTIYRESAWVNSIYVHEDQTDGVEIGWVKGPDRGLVFFGVRVMGGVYTEHLYGPVSPSTSHTDKLVSEVVAGDRRWKYIVDGSVKEIWGHHFVAGSAIRAAQERHSLQDSSYGNTHYWTLKYADSSRSFHPWPNWTTVGDGDPDYASCKVSNTEFWVKRSCP